MTLITIGIIVSAAITIGLVIIQDRSSGVGGAFGGGEGSVYQTRRGMEKFVFIATIVSIITFSGLSILNLYIREHSPAAPVVDANVPANGITATDSATGEPVNVQFTEVDPNAPAPTDSSDSSQTGN